jgi:hypothetical protein
VVAWIACESNDIIKEGEVEDELTIKATIRLCLLQNA